MPGRTMATFAMIALHRSYSLRVIPRDVGPSYSILLVIRRAPPLRTPINPATTSYTRSACPPSSNLHLHCARSLLYAFISSLYAALHISSCFGFVFSCRTPSSSILLCTFNPKTRKCKKVTSPEVFGYACLRLYARLNIHLLHAVHFMTVFKNGGE